MFFLVPKGIYLIALIVFVLILAFGPWFCAAFIADVCGLFLHLPKIVVSRYDYLFLASEAWRIIVFALLEYNCYHQLNEQTALLSNHIFFLASIALRTFFPYSMGLFIMHLLVFDLDVMPVCNESQSEDLIID